MFRFGWMVCVCMLLFNVGRAQDYSNRGLMDIKERSEALRLNWAKAFDDAVQSKNFGGLPALRKENEMFLDRHLSVIRRLYAEGDGRALLSAVNNYLQIEKQFVRDAMVAAEATAGSQEAIDRVYQKITDFGQKEKMFLVEINNALITEGEGTGAPAEQQPEVEMAEEVEEPRGSVMEGRQKSKKKSKLPHEQMDDEDSERKKGDKDGDE